jgi:uncharacterized protein (DUF2141 family)
MHQSKPIIMKKLLILFALFISTVSYSQSNTITVTITHLKSDQGKVRVAIYSGAENFFKKVLYRKTASINGNSAQVVFENIPDGEYAISLYHDENDNGILDSGWFGIPTEGYGCSNNAKGFMGPPKYEDAKFQLTSDKELIITIN